MYSKRRFFFYKTLELIIFLVISPKLFSQGNFDNLHTIYPNSNCSITIKVKKSKVKCEEVSDSKRIKHKVSIENSASLEVELKQGRINNYLSWAFEVWTCEGEHKVIPVTVDLTNFANEGINDLIEQTFEAAEFRLIEGSVKNEQYNELPLISHSPNSPPISISGPSYAYVGNQITLVAEGGVAIPGAKYVWTSDDCNGEVIYKGETNTLRIQAPSNSTRYYVHISSGPNDFTECISKEIKILQLSKKADKIIAPYFVCDNQAKSIILEVQGGQLGEAPNGQRAEWVWRIENKDGIKIMKGQRIKIDQPIASTKFTVSPEGINTVEGISHTIEIASPSDITKAYIISSATKLCLGQSVQLEIKGAQLSSNAMVIWTETNTEKYKNFLSNNKEINVKPTLTTTYGVYISDKCAISSEIKKVVSVINGSVLPENISVDSSFDSRKVKLGFEKDNLVKLNNKSKWVWFSPTLNPTFNVNGYPINSDILETNASKITIRAKKNITTVALKAYGECETNEYISVNIPRKIDKYLFFAFGISSNSNEGLSSRVYTLGSNRIYFRIKQSMDSSFMSNYRLKSYVISENTVTNFSSNSGMKYSLNKNITTVKKSYTMGFFLNQNNFKLYLGGGLSFLDFYRDIDILSTKNNAIIYQSAGKLNNNNIVSPEFEGGISIIFKPFSLMIGTSYISGTQYSPGYFSNDLNLAIVF